MVQLLICLSVVAGVLLVAVPGLKRLVAVGQSSRCHDNLSKIYRGLLMYRFDHDGWWPERRIVTQAGTIKDQNVWISLIAESQYVSDLNSFLCPSDPNIPRFEEGTYESFKRAVSYAPSYGLNSLTWCEYGKIPSDELNIRYEPSRKERTILLADRGPDYLSEELSKEVGQRRSWLELARDAGRLPAADDFRVGVVQPPGSWLTARHGRSINLMAMGGSVVVSHEARELLQKAPTNYYDDCATGDCTYCNVFRDTHYDFSSSGLFWWTGSYGQVPATQPSSRNP